MARRWIEADADGGLRVVVTDYYDGTHSRDEFRATDEEGVPLRAARLPDVAGRPVEHQWEAAGSALYIPLERPFAGRVRVHTETYAVGPTQTTPCPKAENRRRKCPLCDADAARA